MNRHLHHRALGARGRLAGPLGIGSACLVWLATALPAAANKPREKPAMTLEIKPEAPQAGDPVLVHLRGSKQQPTGSVANEKLEFFPTRSGWQAVFAVPLDDAPDELEVVVKGSEEVTETVEVKAREPKKSEAEVDDSFIDPPAEKRAQIREDNHAVRDALDTAGPPQFTKRFAKPGSGRTTSPFGARRTFNDEYKSQHLGWDIAVRKGGPVKAINAGTVTLVRDTFLMGTVVTINHGAGIGSAYYHLSKARVEEGDEVKQGQRIGDVGESGRSNGPHIHLGTTIHGEWIDPQNLLKLPLGPVVAEDEDRE